MAFVTQVAIMRSHQRVQQLDAFDQTTFARIIVSVHDFIFVGVGFFLDSVVKDQ